MAIRHEIAFPCSQAEKRGWGWWGRNLAAGERTDDDALADVRGGVAPEVDAVALRVEHEHRHVAAVENVDVVRGVHADGGCLPHEEAVRDLEVVRDRLVDRVAGDGGGHARHRALVGVDLKRALDRLELHEEGLHALLRVRHAADSELELTEIDVLLLLVILGGGDGGGLGCGVPGEVGGLEELGDLCAGRAGRHGWQQGGVVLLYLGTLEGQVDLIWVATCMRIRL